MDGTKSPFLAQVSFHNCHTPFIGTSEMVESCARNETCRPPEEGDRPYTPTELDYYACLTQLDRAVGLVLDALEEHGYYDNTMIWFASDNGPEVNCFPAGICQDADTRAQRPIEGPGSTGPFRGRKRDIYGGHRVPAIVSWPARIPKARESWETVITTDFLPTIMEVLQVDRPVEQQSWAFDGRSIVLLFEGRLWEDTAQGRRSVGLDHYNPIYKVWWGWGYRHGPWKFVQGSRSCEEDECQRPQLYNLDTDPGERHDLSSTHSDMLLQIQHKFLDWYESVLLSREKESKCRMPGTPILPPSLELIRTQRLGADAEDSEAKSEW